MSMTNYEKWNYWLKDFESPQPFIDWTLYWTISTALQRRIYMGDYRFMPLFPNLFIAFVADPGIGKSVAARMAGGQILKTFRSLDPAKVAAQLPPDKCWTDKVSFSADKTSLESLIQQLNKSTRSFTLPMLNDKGEVLNKPVSHASMAILLSEEMSSLLMNPDAGVDEFLNQCYDAQDYLYKTKQCGEDKVTNVCVSFLGCTTPERMRKLMLKGILQQGFTARTICIYADKPRHRKAEISFTPEQVQAFEEVKNHIKNLLEVKGQVKWTDEANEFFKVYYEGDETNLIPAIERDRVNNDKRLKDYYGRIKVHIKKMSMVLHFMENLNSMEISLATVKKAIAILKEAEVNMHLALAASGRNPLYDIAEKMYKDIIDNGKLSMIQIKILYGSECSQIELDSVIKFLEDIEMVKKEIQNNRLYVLPKDKNMKNLQRTL